MTLVNRLGKGFTWSFSALSSFESCPYRYAAERFFCTTKQDETEAMMYGTLVHKLLEDCVGKGIPIPDDHRTLRPWASAIAKAPGETYCELQFAFDRNMNPVGWFAPDVWARGVIDVLKVNGKKASVVDYKSGRIKNDDTQLKLFAYFVSLLHPEIEEFNCQFAWLKHGTATGRTVHKSELPAFWVEAQRRVAKMEECWANENFPCFNSGLCRGYCPVTECLHYHPKRERR